MIPDFASRFTRFAAVDWSGEAVARPKGLALAVAEPGRDAPVLMRPEQGWSRQEIADWIVDHAQDDILIGLDLSPAFPFLDSGAYFPGWPDSPPDMRSLWALVEQLTRDDPYLGPTGFLAHDEARRYFRQRGDLGDLHPPGRGRLRICELGQRQMGLSPYSCFNLVGAAQVGKSSLTGMRVLYRLAGKVAFWPLDPIPASGAVVVEIYTTIAAREAGLRRGTCKLRDGAALDTALAALESQPHAPLARYSDHATDALLAAAWLRLAARRNDLWQPAGLTETVARVEGWTFGVSLLTQM